MVGWLLKPTRAMQLGRKKQLAEGWTRANQASGVAPSENRIHAAQNVGATECSDSAPSDRMQKDRQRQCGNTKEQMRPTARKARSQQGSATHAGNTIATQPSRLHQSKQEHAASKNTQSKQGPQADSINSTPRKAGTKRQTYAVIQSKNTPSKDKTRQASRTMSNGHTGTARTRTQSKDCTQG